MDLLSAPGEVFFRIFAAAHLNESYADRPLSVLLGFDFYRVLTLVAHWETNYSMADGRAFVLPHNSTTAQPREARPARPHNRAQRGSRIDSDRAT